METAPAFGICWDLGDVIFSEDTEVKTADGVTERVVLVPGIGELLGSLALVMYRGLRALGWSSSSSLCVAVLVSLVPASQVIAAWAVGWPYAATALLAVAAFFTVEGALSVRRAAGTTRFVGQWALGVALFLLGANTVLFFATGSRYYIRSEIVSPR